jgi:hypothetical protein
MTPLDALHRQRPCAAQSIHRPYASAAPTPGPAVVDAALGTPPSAFSDLVGSTVLSARMDPEDLREVITAIRNALLRRCATSVGSWPNTTASSFTSDYPEAHEDDAEGDALELLLNIAARRRDAHVFGQQQIRHGRLRATVR